MSAQWCKNVIMPGSSRFFGPTWFPICTPMCPACFDRLTSAHEASMSCKGTWQRALKCPPARLHISSAESLKMRATSSACSTGR